MLIKMAQEIEWELERISNYCDRNGEMDNTGASWYFELAEPEISGFMWCEASAGSLKVPAVGIELVLDDISQYSREELLRVFELNKNLLGCSLGTYYPEDGAEMLTLIFRADARGFEVDTLKSCIDFLLLQVKGLLGESFALDFDFLHHDIQ